MKKFFVGSGAFLFPVLALAQGAEQVTGTITTVSGLINRFQNVINIVIPFIVGLAVLVIIYGILGYITSGGNEEKRKEAKDFIIWGFIGVFIMLSVWGLVNILINSFNVDNNALRQGSTIQDRTKIPVAQPGSF